MTLDVLVLLGFAAFIALCMLILIGDRIRRAYIAWRELRDMRVRDEKLRRYNIAAFRGAKERQL